MFREFRYLTVRKLEIGEVEPSPLQHSKPALLNTLLCKTNELIDLGKAKFIMAKICQRDADFWNKTRVASIYQSPLFP